MSKVQRKDRAKPGWAAVLADAKAEIQLAERRIEKLRRVVETATIKTQEGQPFPLDKGYQGG